MWFRIAGAPGATRIARAPLPESPRRHQRRARSHGRPGDGVSGNALTGEPWQRASGRCYHLGLFSPNAYYYYYYYYCYYYYYYSYYYYYYYYYSYSHFYS